MAGGARVLILLLAGALLQASTEAEQRKERFWEAARRGDAASVKALLAKGVDVNTRFRLDATALWNAAVNGHTEVVKTLLDHGADPNVAESAYGMTPLVIAAYRGHARIVEMLLAKGASQTAAALRWAADFGHLETVRAILAKGVDAAALSQALAAATTKGHKEVAELLRQAGAAPKGETRLDPQVLERYAGVYKSADGLEFSFAVKDGKLTGGNIFDEPAAWEPVDKTTFQIAILDVVTIAFQMEGDRATGFTLKQHGKSTVFRKAAER